MRSGIGGWVENSDARPCPRNGLAIIRWLWVTSRSSWGSGSAATPPWILRSAEASARGSWLRPAPEASAWYSRLRLTAICTSPAASGPSTISSRQPAPLRPPRAAEHERQQAAHGVAAGPVVGTAAAEQRGEHRQVREVGDDGRHRAGDGADEDVAVVDVRELVGQHRAQLAAVEQLEDPLRAADGGLARVAAGGEGVRLGGRAHEQPGHRLAGLGGQLPDDRAHLRRLGLGDREGPHRAQRELVGVEIGEAVDAERDQQGDEQAPPAADQPPDREDESTHEAEQDGRLERVVPALHARINATARTPVPRPGWALPLPGYGSQRTRWREAHPAVDTST